MNKLLLILLGVVTIVTPIYAQNNISKSTALINNEASKYMPIKSIGMTDCAWTSGFWGDRTELCNDVIVPNLWKLVSDPELSHIYENFLVAAGENEGVFRGFLFGDGDFYKVVEAMCSSYAMTKDEALKVEIDKIVDVIAKAQLEDGYITTGKTVGRGTMMNFDHSFGGKLSKKPRLSSDNDHELYNFGHLFTLACVHYRATGERTLLDVAIKAADFLYGYFGVPSPELASLHWNPPHFMGLVELYRTTGDERYLELTGTFIDMLGSTKISKSDRGLDHSQKRTPFREEEHAVGHAVHANYMYCGVADYVAESGDEALAKSLDSIWSDVAYHKMYVTGATGAHDRTVSHDGVVGEAYGKTYELPNSRGYSETCANIGNVMWNWRMFLRSGDAKYMDIMELALYNSVLSGISLDGKHFYYQNPTRFVDDYKGSHFSSQAKRSEYLNCFCCPPNIVRMIAQINNYAYSLSDKGIWVNLYGGNRYCGVMEDGRSLELSQQSNYPWSGDVTISVDKVEKKGEFSIMLRIPSWCESAVVKVNGDIVASTPSVGDYYECRRDWRRGDKIELEMPMEIQLIEGHPYIEDVTGQVAIKRGPIVYCMESMDLPNGIGINDVVIPRDINLEAQYRDDMLSGATIIKGRVMLESPAKWDKNLYRPISRDNNPEYFETIFIPYFSWNNRERTDMTVWMPLNY